MKIKAYALYAAPTTNYAPPDPSLNLNTWSFHQFLAAEFPIVSGTLTSTRSVKIVKDLVIVRLPIVCPVPFTANILELQQTDNSYVYFTITGHQSEDDNTSNPTTTISGVFDAWMNYVANKPYGWLFGSEEMFVKTGTLGLWTTAAVPIMRIDGDAPNVEHSLSISIKNPVIWAAIRSDADPNRLRYGHGLPIVWDSITRTVVQREDLTPIIYVPVGILDVVQDIQAKMNIKTFINGEVAHDYDRHALSTDIYRFTSTHILSVTYTTQPPFEFTYTYNTSNRELSVSINASNYQIGFAGEQRDDGTSVVETIYEGYSVVGRASSTITGTTREYSETNAPTLSAASRSLTGAIKENLYAPVLKSMPYDFKMLKCADVLIPVSYDDPTHGGVLVSIRCDSLDTAAPFVTPQRRGNNVEFGKVVSTGAQAITRQDREDLYNRNSGSSEQVARNMHYLRTAITAGSGAAQLASGIVNPIGIAQGIGTIGSALLSGYEYDTKLNAMHQDLRNQQDCFSIPSAVGEERLQFLDQVELITYSMNNVTQKNNVLTRIHRFGFGCSCYAPIVQNRIWFDFYQLAEVHADKITNTEHRAAIENTFRSGVRIWYFYSALGSTQPAITCDLTQNNPDVTIADT